MIFLSIFILIFCFTFGLVNAASLCPFPSCKSINYGSACDIYCFTTPNGEFPQRYHSNQISVAYINEIIIFDLKQVEHIPDDALNGLYITHLKLDSIKLLRQNSFRNSIIYNLSINSAAFFHFENTSLSHLSNSTTGLVLKNVNYQIIMQSVVEISRLKQLTELKLISNGFPYLTSNTLLLRSLTNLASLYILDQPILNNNLTINSLIKLKSLNVNRCGLSAIDLNQFYNLRELILLDLSSNLIRRISQNWLRNSTQLNFLMLSENFLSQVPSIFQFTRLKFLDLRSQNDQLVQLRNFAFERKQLNENSNLIINMSHNAINLYENKAFCNSYLSSTNPISKHGLYLYLDNLNFIPNKCMFKQMSNGKNSTLIFTNIEYNCVMKKFASENEVHIYDKRSSTCPQAAENGLIDDCTSDEMLLKYSCSSNGQLRQSVWYGGVSSQHSYTKKYEQCLLRSYKVCLRTLSMTIYCMGEVISRTTNLLSEIRIVFTNLLTGQKYMFIANKTRLPLSFENGQCNSVYQSSVKWLEIFAPQPKNNNNTRLIIDYVEGLSIMIDRIGAYFILVVRARARTLINSGGILSKGCSSVPLIPSGKIPKVEFINRQRVIKKRRSVSDECSMQCEYFIGLGLKNYEVINRNSLMSMCMFDCALNRTLIEFTRRLLQAAQDSHDLDVRLSLNYMDNVEWNETNVPILKNNAHSFSLIKSICNKKQFYFLSLIILSFF
jgi:hypothetical protein